MEVDAAAEDDRSADCSRLVSSYLSGRETDGPNFPTKWLFTEQGGPGGADGKGEGRGEAGAAAGHWSESGSLIKVRLTETCERQSVSWLIKPADSSPCFFMLNEAKLR